MSNQFNSDHTCCEYRDCEKEGNVFDDNLNAWLCNDHQDSPSNSTGYCPRDCQLGHGCDGSC